MLLITLIYLWFKQCHRLTKKNYYGGLLKYIQPIYWYIYFSFFCLYKVRPSETYVLRHGLGCMVWVARYNTFAEICFDPRCLASSEECSRAEVGRYTHFKNIYILSMATFMLRKQSWVQLSSCNRDCMTHNAKNIYCLALQKQFSKPCFRRQPKQTLYYM